MYVDLSPTQQEGECDRGSKGQKVGGGNWQVIIAAQLRLSPKRGQHPGVNELNWSRSCCGGTCNNYLPAGLTRLRPGGLFIIVV